MSDIVIAVFGVCISILGILLNIVFAALTDMRGRIGVLEQKAREAMRFGH